MSRIKSVIVSVDNKEIVCEYYEIEEIFREFIESDPTLLSDFTEFARDYSYFSPYIDYAMFRLGYKIKNPLNLKNATLEAKENAIFLTQFSQSFEIFPKADDKTIRLSKLSPDNIEVSMADSDLNMIRPKFHRHSHISLLILNYLFMKDQDLYLKFVGELIDEETSALMFDYTNFLINNASFLRIEKIVVNEKLRQFQVFKDKDISYEIVGSEKTISEAQKQFLEECLAKGILKNEDIHIASEERNKKV